MNAQRRAQKGFSLVEIMFSVALSALVAYAAFVIQRASTEQMQTMSAKMTIEDSAREGLYKMIQEIRLSAPDKVTIGNTGQSIEFRIPNPSDPVDEEYRPNWDDSHKIRYTLGGLGNRQLIRTNATTNTTEIIANDVTSISFAGDSASPRLVTVTMGLQKSITNTRQVTSVPMQYTGRAEIKNP